MRCLSKGGLGITDTVLAAVQALSDSGMETEMGITLCLCVSIMLIAREANPGVDRSSGWDGRGGSVGKCGS